MAKAPGDSVLVEKPRLVEKALQRTVGIRERIAGKTIAAAIPRLLRRTRMVLRDAGLGIPGRPFFRFHSINRGVGYDLGVGYLNDSDLPQIVRLTQNAFPRGMYIALKYGGKNRGYQGSAMAATIYTARRENHAATSTNL